MRIGATFAVAAACVVVAAAPASAEEPTARDAMFEPYCTPTDPGLAELSGMTFLGGGTLFAMGDSGADDRVAALDPDCTVTQWIPNPVDPYDVEDLSSFAADLWLADIGDNDGRRDTVALTRLDPNTGQGDVHRLTYPDGAHDAEALLIGGDSVPVIVTKDPLGQSGIYSPEVSVWQLPTPGPVPMQKVGSVTIDKTSTVGGPPLLDGTRLVTGGAVSGDGTVAALRTYTDLYLFHAADGNLLSALTAGPVKQIPLPDQPQGESLAFALNGDLLIGSEQGIDSTATLPPIQVLRGAAELAVSEGIATEGMPIEGVPTDGYEEGPSPVLIALAAAVAVGAIAGAIWLVRLRW